MQELKGGCCCCAATDARQRRRAGPTGGPPGRRQSVPPGGAGCVAASPRSHVTPCPRAARRTGLRRNSAKEQRARRRICCRCFRASTKEEGAERERGTLNKEWLSERTFRDGADTASRRTCGKPRRRAARGAPRVRPSGAPRRQPGDGRLQASSACVHTTVGSPSFVLHLLATSLWASEF